MLLQHLQAYTELQDTSLGNVSSRRGSSPSHGIPRLPS